MKPRRVRECLLIPPRLGKSQIAPAGFAIQQPGSGLKIRHEQKWDILGLCLVKGELLLVGRGSLIELKLAAVRRPGPTKRELLLVRRGSLTELKLAAVRGPGPTKREFLYKFKEDRWLLD
jgi:hypothetical protein